MSFPSGTGSVTVTGNAKPGEVHWYVLNGTQAQPMIARLDSKDSGLALSVRTQGGTSFLSPSSGQVSWRGSLPRTEDYYVGVFAGSSAEDFVLKVELASRIKFKEGSATASVGGKTYGGATAVFTVLGIKGQTLIVSLSGSGRDASLGVYGYVNGDSYLQAGAGKTSFKLKVPFTQDYVIEVVPKGGKTVPYVLDVQFP
jgi:hypothetical protein